MFDATRLLQTLTDALSLGSLYALIAIGYTMVYGVLRLINFAHGEIFMIAMYIVFYGISMFSLPWYVTFAVTILVTALLGTLAERLAYRPLRSAPITSSLFVGWKQAHVTGSFVTITRCGWSSIRVSHSAR